MKWILGVTLMIVCCFGDSLGLILIKEDVKNTNDGGQVNCDIVCRTENDGIFESIAKQSNCRCSISAEGSQLHEVVLNDDEAQSNMKSNFEDTTLVLSKRDTLQNLIAKNKKNLLAQKNSKTLSIEKPRKSLPQKKLAKNVTLKPKIKGFSIKPPASHQKLQERFRDLKARMSAKPQMRTRGDFNGDEKPNLIEQFKTRQEEFREKIKKGNFSPTVKSGILKTSHVSPNRIDISKAKIESKKTHRMESGQIKKTSEHTEDIERVGSISSSTTETPKVSKIPIIILTSSTTSTPRPAPIVKSTNSDTAESNTKKMEAISSAIERIKEKQKEAVTKIKDKISTGIKSKDKEEISEKKDTSNKL